MDEQTMSFWDHLEVFRGSLVRIVIILLIFMVGCFFAMPYIYNPVILGPTHGDFFLYRWVPLFKEGFSCDIININVASQFMTHVTTSFWLALVLSFPVVMWEIWKFVSPALYKNESRPVGFAFLFGTGMFYLGCAVGYCIIFPFMFRFLTEYQLSAEITNQINLNSYMHSFLMMIFVMGLVFELPLLIWLLSRLGLVNKQFLRKYRRHAIVILMVLAAFITPSGDPFTLMITFTPLYLLYELGIFLARPEEPSDDSDDEEDDDEEEDDDSRPAIDRKAPKAPVASLEAKASASKADKPVIKQPSPSDAQTAESKKPQPASETPETESSETKTEEHKASRIPDVAPSTNPFLPDPPKSPAEARAQADALGAVWNAAITGEGASTDEPAGESADDTVAAD